jgi:hypothetical protein
MRHDLSQQSGFSAKPDRLLVSAFRLLLPENTAALARWAEHLQAVVAGEPAKVVPLRAATA